MKRMSKIACGLAVLGLLVAGGASLTAEAARPIGPPLCGFTALWNCDMPFGPDRQISGTVCDIRRFERRTGATCELAGI